MDGASVGIVSSYTFTNVTANHTITASFAINTYTLTATANANGTMTPSGAVNLNSGATQTFTITPNPSYHVSDVRVDGATVGIVSSYTFTNVTANHTITASFAINTYAITVTSSAGGNVVPSGIVTLNSGATQTFSMMPNAGYSITNLVVDGTAVATAATYTFSNIIDNHTINVTFADTTPPTGTIVINGGAAYTNSQNITLNLSASDSGSGVSQMQFSNDNTTWSEAELYATTKAWSLPAGDGSKTVNVKYKDVAGNWSTGYPRSIMLDTTPPITSTVPAGGIYNNTQSVNLMANESANIYYTTDGTVPTTASTVYQGPIIAAGSTTIKFFSVDLAGNTETVKNITITIDPTPPVIELSTLVDGSLTNITPMNITGSLMDTNGIASLMISSPTITPAQSVTLSTSDNVNYTYSFPVTLAAGSNVITLVVTDLAGNTTTAMRTVIYDTTVPNMIITSPADNSYSNQFSTAVSGTVDKPVTVLLSVNSGPTTTAITGGMSFSQPVSLATNTVNTITITATDLAGNTATAKRTITVDTLSPALSVTQPGSDISTNQSGTTLAGTVNDTDTVVVTVSCPTANVGVVSYPTASTWQVLVTGMTQTVNVFTVTATDAAGNQTAVQRNIIYDTAPPTLSLNPVSSPTNSNTQMISGTMEDGSMVTVACFTATVGMVSYPTITIWQAMLTNMTEGSNSITVTATDQAGNVSSPVAASIVLDTVPPVTSATPAGGVYGSAINVTLASSETETIYYTIDGTIPTTGSSVYLGPISITAPTALKFFAMDLVGNSEPVKTEVYDFTATTPTINITSLAAGFINTKTPLLTYTISSGAARVSVDGTVVNVISGQNLGPLTEGQHIVRVESTDTGGVFSSVTFTVDTIPPMATAMPTISAGWTFSAAIAVDGSLTTWGSNWSGCLGDGLGDEYDSPEKIGTDQTWAAVSAGENTVLAIKKDGTLWAWGANSNGQVGDGTTDDKNTPVQIGSDANWRLVAESGIHSVALKQDGTLWAWGYNDDGELGDGTYIEKHSPVQIGTDNDWVVIATGGNHTLALKANGTLWAWGWNAYGQLGDDGATDVSSPKQIGTDTNWTAIAANWASSFALKSDGTLWAWGYNDEGELGDGTIDEKHIPVQVGTDRDWAVLATGTEAAHTLALKSDGTLWAWGWNDDGELGDGTYFDKHSPIQVGNDTTWSLIAGGDYHSVGVKLDGTTWTWGWNGYGQLGDGTTQDWNTPHVINNISISTQRVPAIVINNGAISTNTTTIALSLNVWDATSGVAFMQFSNDNTTWTAPEPYATTKSWAVSPGDGVKTVYAKFQDGAGNWSPAYSSSIMLDTAPPTITLILPAFGMTNNNMPMLSYTANKQTSDVIWLDGIQVAYHSGDNMGPLSDGLHRVRVTCTDEAGNAGFAEVMFTIASGAPALTVSIASPAPGFTNNAAPVLSYSVNYGTVTVLVDGAAVGKASGDALGPLSDGAHEVRVVSTDAAGQAASAKVDFIIDTNPPLQSIISRFAQLALGDTTAVALTADGDIWQWGTITSSSENCSDCAKDILFQFPYPKAISLDHSWNSIDVGLSSILAIRKDGTLWAWGSNFYGQLGDGTTDDNLVPAQIGSETTWRAISTSGLHSAGIKTDGTLWTWGINSYGQLGDDTTEDKHVPVRIGSDTNWIAVSAGAYHTVALRSDGTVWAWGENWEGEIGDGTNYDRWSPVQAGQDADWAAISAGSYYTIALKKDGTLWAWGGNWQDQLGEGSGMTQYSPVQIGTDSNWSAISAGDAHALALKKDGTLWSWGGNWYGQLGNGTDGPQYTPSVPTQIGSDNNWAAIAAGMYNSVALRMDGSVWAWGWNYYGVLGDGTYLSENTPTLVNYVQGTNNVLSLNGGAALTDNPLVTLTINAWDTTSNIVNMQFSNDGTTWSAPEPYAASKDWMLTSSSGNKTVYAKFQDAAGYWSSAVNATIALHALPPTVTIISPASGFTISNTPLLNYTVNAVDDVLTAEVDGSVVNTPSGAALDLLTDGTHTVRVEAVDANGLMGYAEVTFIVDSIPPTVTINTPAAGFTNNSTPSLAYTLNKEMAMTTVKVDGLVVNKAAGHTLDALADGSHKLRVEVTDAYGYKTFAETSFIVDTTPPSGTVQAKFVAVSAGGGHSLAIASNGTLWAWGLNANGQLGDATAEDKHVPVQIGQDRDWAVVAAGGSFSMAKKTDGSLWAWGANGRGQLGNGTTNEQHTPTRIGDAKDWVAISAGGSHAAAIKSGGSLFMWGSNTSGQIGNGTYNDVYQPYQSDFTHGGSVGAILLGGAHSVAFADGMVWTWGNNWFNQLARFSCVPFNEPGPIEFGAWAELSAGNEHTIALRPDGTLWAWGDNANCVLGNSSVGQQSWGPVPIGADADWKTISAGGTLNGALKSDGSLWTWGGSSGCSPVRKGTGTDVVAVSAGGSHGLALGSDGSLLSWGDNTYGQLGDGTTYSWSDPHPITATTGTHTPIKINLGANVASSATVTLTLFDWDTTSATTTMEFSNDNTSWTDPEPYTTTKTWTLTPGDGPKTVFVKFQDAAGNWSAPYSATIQLIEGAPDVTITSPKSGLTRNITQLLTYAAGEGTVVVKVDGTPVNKVSGDTLGPFPEGSHTIRVEVTNTANITGFAETTFTVATTAPTVIITSPQPGLTNNTTPMLTYTVSDGTVVVTVDGIAVNRVSGDTLPVLYDSTHTVRVEATNAAGVTGSAQVTLTIDTIRPTVALISPTPGVTNNRTPVLLYTINDWPIGPVTVKVDGAVVNKTTSSQLDALADGNHTVRVEETDTAGNTGASEVAFTVDTIPPTLSISSPIAGTTNLSSLPLIYAVSDGTVVVKLDNAEVNNASGSTLDTLPNGPHIVRVEATDAANNISYAEVAFTVDASAAGNDDTNIYCKGTGTYMVGPSNFTSGIAVPTTGNAILIASPYDGATINGPRTIVKGAMDTTVPVNSVMVVVTNTTGTTGYLAQVNGNYFAAQVPVTADVTTISAVATDQTGTQHQASVSVTVTTQSDNTTLSAAPSVGIPTLKQSGKTTLDVALMSTATMTAPVASYAWDFDGSGSNELTCYRHSNVKASYQQVGLYLTQVAVTDSAGNTYRDAAIVNVSDRDAMDNIFKPIWNGMKNALINGDTAGALNFIAPAGQQKYSNAFSALQSDIAQIAAAMQDIELVYIHDTVAKYRIRRENLINGEYKTITYYIYYRKDQNGQWLIDEF